MKGKRAVAFALLLPFRMVFWGTVALFIFLKLQQEGYIERKDPPWEERQAAMYEQCIAKVSQDVDYEWLSKQDYKSYCRGRTTHSAFDTPY
tara:strand:- start:97 stop:369 length:273 start_codon:yes stop_codon:yes gene_type:complete